MGVKKRGEIGERVVGFCPPSQSTRFYFLGSSLQCKLSSKLSENCDRKRGDRKDRHTDAGDFIICPMLCYSNGTDKQESCAIAKMTAQCALHMVALTIFGTPWDSLTMPTALFPTFSWAFVPINTMNVPTKFEVHSFTRS